MSDRGHYRRIGHTDRPVRVRYATRRNRTELAAGCSRTCIPEPRAPGIPHASARHCLRIGPTAFPQASAPRARAGRSNAASISGTATPVPSRLNPPPARGEPAVARSPLSEPTSSAAPLQARSASARSERSEAEARTRCARIPPTRIWPDDHSRRLQPTDPAPPRDPGAMHLPWSASATTAEATGPASTRFAYADMSLMVDPASQTPPSPASPRNRFGSAVVVRISSTRLRSNGRTLGQVGRHLIRLRERL